MKVVFYSLHAAIWRHSAIENRLVRELVNRGCDTVYVSCGSTFTEHCTSYSAESIGLDAPRKAKDRICQLCKRNARLLASASGARHLMLRDFLSVDDETCIDELMAQVTPENYVGFRHLDVDVGRATSYECFLLYKKMSEHLNEEEWRYYRTYLRNALQSLIGFARIFDRERPDLVFFYSPQYGVNGSCAQYAEIRGAKTYFIEGSASNGERYEALRIWDWRVHGLVNPALAHWSSVRERVTAEDVRRVTGHFRELLEARSYAVYSTPVADAFDLRVRFNIPATAKVLLATLSSFDEAYAAFVIGKFPERKVRSPVYGNQFDWIKDTIRRLAGRRDVYLIVRVHPRDYPNKRDPRQSEQAALWEQMFANLPENVRVNWPQDGISLYNMLDQVDAVVTGWSATGIEALVFGVPVVTYDRWLPSYPSDIHFSGDTAEEYFANIDRALACEHGFAVAAQGYRWLAAHFSMGTVRLEPLSSANPAPWQSRLIPGVIRRWLNGLAEKRLKRLDACGGFQSQVDADRFYELCRSKDASLYESILRNPHRSDDPSTLDAIRRELDCFHGLRRRVTLGGSAQQP